MAAEQVATGNQLFHHRGWSGDWGAPGSSSVLGSMAPSPPEELTHAPAEGTRLRPAGMGAQRQLLEVHNAPEYHVPGLRGRVGRARSTSFLSGRLGGVVVQSSVTLRDPT